MTVNDESLYYLNWNFIDISIYPSNLLMIQSFIIIYQLIYVNINNYDRCTSPTLQMIDTFTQCPTNN